MCLATTGRITALEDDGALIQIGGRLRWASTALVPDLRVGDYVLVSAITILDRITADEAALIENASADPVEVQTAAI